MAMPKNAALQVQVIGVDEAKCVNCHTCISVCPVKYCIDGSKEKVAINHDLCIGCGTCVKACKQGARFVIDDAEAFLAAVARKEPIIAIAAPALVSSFPGQHGNFLGWLKRLGVEACFDVSFGAELTVKSYLDHVANEAPRLVIAQPCPAIVSYVETYRPELLPYLAPADSPMLHTVKMVREYYPKYAGHKVLVISPCAAKKREFAETGLGDFNVTLASFAAIMKTRRVDLSREAPAGFENPPAERGVLFSSPGGLLRTALRDAPGISSRARKIEGAELIYPYLDGLAASLAKGSNPLLVDCLNCAYGCNAGPGTLNQDKSPDDFEGAVERRREEAERVYSKKPGRDGAASKRLAKVLNAYWKPGLYARSYVDRSSGSRIDRPSDAEFKEIYASLKKVKEEDFLNCSSCGYKSCEGMAIAIHNGLNRKENCHLYRHMVIHEEKTLVTDSTTELLGEIERSKGLIDGIRGTLEALKTNGVDQSAALEQSTAAVEAMIATLSKASGIASGKREQLQKLSSVVKAGEQGMAATLAAIGQASDGVSGISEMIGVINDVADKTNLLSMNAAIQAAHAGAAGKSFAVVAAEIRSLAEATGGNARRISAELSSVVDCIQSANGLSAKTGQSFNSLAKETAGMTQEMGSLLDSLVELGSGGTQISTVIGQLRKVSTDVKELYDRIALEAATVLKMIIAISSISEDTQRKIGKID